MFNFNLTVSDQAFEVKPKQKDYSKITFSERTVTRDDMKNLIEEGRLFAGIFNQMEFHIKQKKKENFVSTQVIPIDIDDCDCSMMDYILNLRYMPTFAYETFSNLQEGKGYRFRLLYVLKDCVEGGDNYTLLYNAICRANDINEFNDKSTGTCNQAYFGTCKDRAITSVGPLYIQSQFDNFIDENDLNKGWLNDSVKREHTGNIQVNEPPITDQEFERYWKKASDADILKHFQQYNSPTETGIDFEDGELYRFIDDVDYFKVWRKWKMRLGHVDGRMKKLPMQVKLKNGEGRRKHIFISLVIRRFITPTLTFEHLLYGALYELHWFVDNTDKDDTITRKQLKQIANSAYHTDLSKYDMAMHRSFKVNTHYCKQNGINVMQVVGKANGERNTKRKMERYATYLQYYDPSKTNKENIQVLDDNGISVSLASFKRFKGWLNDSIRKNTTGNIQVNEPPVNKQYTPLDEETDMDMLGECAIIPITTSPEHSGQPIMTSMGHYDNDDSHTLNGKII